MEINGIKEEKEDYKQIYVKEKNLLESCKKQIEKTKVWN
jgi:hypothetical protein